MNGVNIARPASASAGITQAIMDDVLARLHRDYASDLMVSFYPEDPQGYRLNHPRGALLLGFSHAQFSPDRATDTVWVERDLTLPLTLVFRQLNGPAGVIHYLDRVRDTLTGLLPAHCDRPLRPIAERFAGQQPGIWQYAQEWSTRTVHVQSLPPESGALLNRACFEYEEGIEHGEPD